MPSTLNLRSIVSCFWVFCIGSIRRRFSRRLLVTTLTLLMATMVTPELLLLDEHTAALDPATAAKVLEISDKIVRDGKLTALMITHNMTDAIRHGNRLIMMDQGRIVLDISGEDKQKLTKADLLARFAQTTGTQEETDSVLLS